MYSISILSSLSFFLSLNIFICGGDVGHLLVVALLDRLHHPIRLTADLLLQKKLNKEKR